MAALDDLISQISDPDLRDRIQKEVDKLSSQKKFGLVYENHLPEYTPLYGMDIKRGCNVIRKNDKDDKAIYTVYDLNGDIATCYKRDTPETPTMISVNDIVRIAEFGEPIYPYLKPIDSVCNDPGSDLWHTLIEADNYHALQLLEYLYAGKVDCIYIDPPYNTGAKDWKYNNDYVDSSDSYRHSKWLSMMEKRLKLAKKLLNPADSVLIVTIDEKEYLHLGCLLEELFPEAYIQMITIVTNPKGSTRGHFSRVDEYAFYCFLGNAVVEGNSDPMLGDIPVDSENCQPRWKGLLRSGIGARREDSPNLFYPILVDKKNNLIIRAEHSLPLEKKVDYSAKIDGYDVAWPIRNDGTDGRWMLSSETFNDMLSKGYIQLGKYDSKRKTWGFSYLSKKYQEQIKSGELIITGKSENGQSLIVEFSSAQERQVKTVWHRTRHDAGAYGSDLVSNVIGRTRAFTYPKSLYAEKDSISMVTKNKPDALIIDFFAGSGTTLHAVNLLNAEDGGHRRCIMVTNNEVSDDEAKTLSSEGYHPGDPEWEQYGIARYVTWPRTVCSIEGHDVNGQPLKGNYLGSDMPMADGFKANVAFFSLGFLDKTSVALGMQFKELLPTLWMKAGSIGPCPVIDDTAPDMLILPQNKFAVLNDENVFSDFKDKLQQYPEIQTVFLVTDYDVNYRSMSNSLNVQTTYQLYRDYLDNFRINQGRD